MPTKPEPLIRYAFGKDFSEQLEGRILVPPESEAAKVHRIEERLKRAMQIGSGLFATLRIERNRDIVRALNAGAIDEMFKLIDQMYLEWKRHVDD